jgi:hypothetical protein
MSMIIKAGEIMNPNLGIITQMSFCFQCQFQFFFGLNILKKVCEISSDCWEEYAMN